MCMSRLRLFRTLLDPEHCTRAALEWRSRQLSTWPRLGGNFRPDVMTNPVRLLRAITGLTPTALLPDTMSRADGASLKDAPRGTHPGDGMDFDASVFQLL